MDQLIIIAGLLTALALIEAWRGRFFKKTATWDDRVVEVFSTLIVPLLVVPTIFLVTYQFMDWVLPQYKDSLAELSGWVMLGLLLIFDDMVQYWYHRLAHSVPFLFNFHRAHHEARYMSIRVVYRNGFLYYSLLPPLYTSAVMIYLGLGEAYLYYGLVKVVVIMGAHCAVPWDAFLYRHSWLSPLAWVIERTISTPSTHHAHHGMNPADGVTNYNGNFGNLLFFWDVLFGTARITRRYPEAFGVAGEPRPDYLRQIFFPLFRGWRGNSKKPIT
jgi:sterol desaturase/sphingolipid hydroxylase (fatty acid hydroxylase superfamily)